MSKRHQASRRRTYGRRQHEIRERRERDWRVDGIEKDPVDDGFAPAEAPTADYMASAFGATWLGLE
jgi:hypothetical protein